MALDSLQDLLLDELRDLYHAELQIAKSLPRLARAARTPVLRNALRDHLEETEHQIERLEHVFDTLGERGTGRKSRAMMGLLDEGADIVDEEGSEVVKDAALIAAIQRVEHWEIAAYGTVITHANMLGHSRVARLLEESLREEKRADEKLTIIAEEDVNRMAIAVGEYDQTTRDRGDHSWRQRKQYSRT
jgi:ferritin-like metal-binding protein YciE